MHKYSMWQNTAMLIGRVLFSLIFICAGIDKVLHYNAATSHMISHGIPFAGIMVIVVLVIEIVAGFAVLAGVKTRWAAGLLLLLVLAYILIFHQYGSMETAVQAQMQVRHWVSNMAIIAAALYIISFGAGRFSVDHWK
jgi:putative oxidoreductase